MQQSTQTEIIKHLKLHPFATVFTISRALNLTRADVRYHLNILLKQKFVVKQPIHYQNHAGRPAFAFSLESSHYPDNLEEVILTLIAISEDKNLTFFNLAESLAKKFPNSTEISFVQKINKMVQFLNERNYCAHWETHKSGPILFFQNCPYRKILASHPDFCAMDIEMIQQVLGYKVDHLQSINHANHNVCKFQLLFTKP